MSNTTVISLNNVTVSYGGTTALRNFTGVFQPGTITAIIGGDGAGKTTLLKLLAGQLLPDTGELYNPYQATEIGYQPASSGTWHNLSVAENLDFSAQMFQLDPSIAKKRGQQLLHQAGLSYAHNRLAKQLSGGMRQKLGVVLATLHQPPLVLLDEPTTGVDPISRAELWAMITAAAAEGATVVFATTYLDEAERAQQVCLLNEGELITSGSPAEIINTTPGQLWRRSWEIPGSVTSDSWRRGKYLYAWTPSTENAPGQGFSQTECDLENASIMLLLRQETKPKQPLLTEMTTNDQPALPLVAATNIGRKFKSVTALDSVDLEVHSGEIVGLIGGNGAGKTTLMRILLGLEQPTTGVVQLFGAVPSIQVRKQTGYVAQGVGLYPTLSARENLAVVAAMYQTEIPKAIASYTDSLGSTPVARLPLGTCRRLAFMAAVMHRPKLLIADEPTSGMDALSRVHLWRDLRTLADQGTGILITTHYTHEAEQCDRLIVLTYGKLSAAGAEEQLIKGKQTLAIKSSDWRGASKLLQANGIISLFDGHSIRVPLTESETLARKLLSADSDTSFLLQQSSLSEALLQAMV